MLAKLTEITQIKDQTEYLTQLIDKGAKNSKQFIDELNQDILSKLQKKINSQNFQLWLQLAISMLSVQQKFQYASANKQFGISVLKLVDIIGSQNVQTKHEKVAKILSKYSGMQTSILFHAFLAKHCAKGANQNKLNRLLPIFIRLSSFIIQQFLQLKNEPAKGSEDRIEDDKVILQCCQKWVANNISLFFNNLTPPREAASKGIVLMAICDVVGALLQTIRENIINKEIAQKLLHSLLKYCQANMAWNYFYQTYMSALSLKNFNNPIKKIQIPQLYADDYISKIGPNTQAYVFIMVHYIKIGLDCLNNQTTLLKILIPLVSQIVSRPYQIKIQAIYLLQKTIQCQTPIKIKNGFQFGYPIQLLFFDLFNFQNQKFQSIRKHFTFETQDVQVNSLLSLKNIELANLKNQKDKYILKTITKNKLTNIKLILIIKKFQWKQQKPKSQSMLLEAAEKMKQKHGKDIKQLVKSWKQQSIEAGDQKIKGKINSLLQ